MHFTRKRGAYFPIKTYIKEHTIATATVAAASTVELWAPAASWVVFFVPYVGPVLSQALQYAPILTTLATGGIAMLIIESTITPREIADIAKKAKFNEWHKTQFSQ